MSILALKKFTLKDVDEWAKTMRVSKDLDQYENKILFPKKLEEANIIVKKYKLPK